MTGVRILENSGDTFLLYDSDGDLRAERQFPFVTIVTGDNYDSDSKLNRPGAYRVNIGLTKATYDTQRPVWTAASARGVVVS